MLTDEKKSFSIKNKKEQLHSLREAIELSTAIGNEVMLK